MQFALDVARGRLEEVLGARERFGDNLSGSRMPRRKFNIGVGSAEPQLVEAQLWALVEHFGRDIEYCFDNVANVRSQFLAREHMAWQVRFGIAVH